MRGVCVVFPRGKELRENPHACMAAGYEVRVRILALSLEVMNRNANGRLVYLKTSSYILCFCSYFL